VKIQVAENKCQKLGSHGGPGSAATKKREIWALIVGWRRGPIPVSAALGARTLTGKKKSRKEKSH